MQVSQQQVLGLKKIQISPEMTSLLQGIWHKRLEPRGIAFSYLAARTFGIVRFPTRPDRNVCHDDQDSKEFRDAIMLLDGKTEAQWKQLEEELRDIHRATKAALMSLTSGATVQLERAIVPSKNGKTAGVEYNRYSDDVDIFPAYAQAAITAGLAHIDIDIDIVSGWSIGSLQRYGDLHLQHEWDLDDVIIVSDLLATATSSSGPLEANEWLCINRNPGGLFRLDVTGLRVDGVPTGYNELLAEFPSVSKLADELRARASKQATTRRIASRPNDFPVLQGRTKHGVISQFCNRLAIFFGKKGW